MQPPRRVRYYLDEVSVRALAERPGRLTQATGDEPGPGPEPDNEDGPEALLWAALFQAPEEGIPVADLVAATERSHRWVNYRLKALANVGRAVQIKRGVWRHVSREVTLSERRRARAPANLARVCIHRQPFAPCACATTRYPARPSSRATHDPRR
jgi:hypothetical protein